MIVTFVRAPDALHAVAVQRHARQLTERFAYVEVAQRRDLEAGHLVALRVQFRLLGGHLPFESEMQPIADQHFGDAGRVLKRVYLIEIYIDTCFVCAQSLTSSTSFSHRPRPSKLHLFVMSYTRMMPCAPREYDRMIVQKRPCPDVSQICSLTRLPSSRMVVVLYAVCVCGHKKGYWAAYEVYDCSTLLVWVLQLPPPLQNGLSVEPSSRPAMISCLPTSLSPTSSTFSR